MVNPDKLKKAELIDELVKYGVSIPTPTTKHLKAVYLDLYKTHITNGAESKNNGDLDYDNLNDNDLKIMLAERGVSVGPIQSSTRQVYLNKLKKLLTDEKQDSTPINVPDKKEDEELFVMLQSSQIPVAARETRSSSRRRTMVLSQPPVMEDVVNIKSNPQENGHGDGDDVQVIGSTKDREMSVEPEKRSMSVDPVRRSRSMSVEPQAPQVQELLTESNTVRQRSVKPEPTITEAVTETSMMTEPEDDQQTSLIAPQAESSAKCSLYLKLSITFVVVTLLILCLHMKVEKSDIENFLKQLQE